ISISVNTTDTDLRKKVIDSCRNSCGKWRVLPCSCDSKCLVYGNCCEDFELECSDIVQESKTKFTSLVHSSVKCMDDTFVIASCADKKVFIDNSSSSSTTRRNVNALPGYEWSDIELLRNLVPVTDLSTGFTFINKTVLKCHNGNLSSAVHWDVAVNDIKNIFNITFQKILIENVHNDKVYTQYTSPRENSDIFMTSSCSDGSVGTCLKEDHPLDFKCKSFISYVKNTQSRVFNNKYCAYCNGFVETSNLAKTKRNKHELNFDVLMSVNEGTIKLIPRAPVGVILFNKWEKIECRENVIEMVNNYLNTSRHCDIICSQGFTYHAKKICKKSLILEMAISANVFSFRNPNMTILTDYVMCFLDRILQLEVHSLLNFSQVNHFYGNNGSFCLVEILIYERNVSLLVDNLMVKDYIPLLANNLLQNPFMSSQRTIDHSPKVNTSLNFIKVCWALYSSGHKDSDDLEEIQNSVVCRDRVKFNYTEADVDYTVCLNPVSRCNSVHVFLFHLLLPTLCLLLLSTVTNLVTNFLLRLT
ncbi:Aquaporin-7, partial [Biomphalaria glabrata]